MLEVFTLKFGMWLVLPWNDIDQMQRSLVIFGLALVTAMGELMYM